MFLNYFLSILFLFLFNLVADENLSQLLNVYKNESELSKITKKESAGFVDIYTRNELEKMQVHNLLDVLKTLPALYLTRGANSLTLIGKPSISQLPSSAIRLYINDHDMSSSSFGSAFMVWGEMPIEYIDHIEIYKGSSSIEFGNETATIIMRLYTKTSEREEGGKARVMADTRGSYDANAYYAQTLENGFSYFAYVNSDNLKNDVYHNSYNNKTYDFNSDKNGYNLYANLSYDKWILELGHYSKRNDSFLGIGVHKTPTGGELNAGQTYAHISKKFDDGTKLQLSYDDLSYERTYVDPNGIRVANIPNFIDDYSIIFDDKIFSAVLEKSLEVGSHNLFLGGFYKNKAYKERGDFKNSDIDFQHKNSFSNYLDLYSIYAEDSYDYDDNTRFIASFKGDFFRFNKEIKSQDELVVRLGGIKNIDKFQFKLFLIKTYIPNELYKLYNSENIPYKSNPNLDNTQIYMFRAGARYKDENSELELIVAGNEVSDVVVYNPTKPWGFENSSDKSSYLLYQLKYSYQFDYENKVYVDVYTGSNNKDIQTSPKYGASLRFFNTYKKFDFYNELIFRTSYENFNISMEPSYDYTSAVKYNISSDFSAGVRAENIFDTAYKQAYRTIGYSIPVTQQKFWLNLEYLF